MKYCLNISNNECNVLNICLFFYRYLTTSSAWIVSDKMNNS